MTLGIDAFITHSGQRHSHENIQWMNIKIAHIQTTNLCLMWPKKDIFYLLKYVKSAIGLGKEEQKLVYKFCVSSRLLTTMSCCHPMILGSCQRSHTNATSAITHLEKETIW